MGARRLLGAWLCAAIAALALAADAQACSCAPQPPAESLRESDAAIVGKLVDVSPHGQLRADYRYEVRHVYAGPSIETGRILTVRSARRAAACALPRRTGREYGLFLSYMDGHWFGGICGVLAPRRLRHAARNQAAGEGSAQPTVGPVLCGQ